MPSPDGNMIDLAVVSDDHVPIREDGMGPQDCAVVPAAECAAASAEGRLEQRGAVDLLIPV